MAARFQLIGFDADDTLWQNEDLYAGMQERYTALLEPYRPRQAVLDALYETEMRNLKVFGYGIKGFTLSMIETAIQITGGEVHGREIEQIIGFAREMTSAEIRLLDQVHETVAALAQHYPLAVITKGDLLDQETKLARSGLGEYFQQFEIVSDKTVERYAALLERLHVRPEEFLMVGNSLRSDILPVLELGAEAVYIPYRLVWAHEQVDLSGRRYYELENMGQLPALIEKIEREK